MAVGLTITLSLSSLLPLTRALAYELPLLCVLYKPSLNTSLLWGGGLQQNGGEGGFFGSLLMGKGTCAPRCPPLSPMASPPLSSPAACVPSLGCMSLALTLAPAPAAPNKGDGQHRPFSSPKSLQSGQPQGSSQLHPFSHQYNLPGGKQLGAGSCWGQVKAAEGTLWVYAIHHALLALGEANLRHLRQMPLHSHGSVVAE